MTVTAVVIDYTNWRGERSTRRIIPKQLLFQATTWHPDEQWLIRALDLDKGEARLFALSGVHSWEPIKKSAAK